MRLVVDCSVVASFLLPDERHPYSLGVKDCWDIHTNLVPQLFWLELSNIFLTRERKGLLKPEETKILIKEMERSGIVTVPEMDMEFVLLLARQHKLTSYDATYLALAVKQKAKLATLDEALKKAAISENLFYNPAA